MVGVYHLKEIKRLQRKYPSISPEVVRDDYLVSLENISFILAKNLEVSLPIDYAPDIVNSIMESPSIRFQGGLIRLVNTFFPS